MAENCYCSVQFQTGEELNEALMKAKTACDEADKAIARNIEQQNYVKTINGQPAADTMRFAFNPSYTLRFSSN